jgi:hypothetical protein
VRIACATEKAASVDDVSLCGYAISFLYIGDETSNFDDIAREFMTDDEWRLAS